jgi:hypothetical protein
VLSGQKSRLKIEMVRKEKITNDILLTNSRVRLVLIIALSIASLLWLIFTSIIICLIGNSILKLSDSVAIAFITTSLATVVGLWAIGLRYFFHRST